MKHSVLNVESIHHSNTENHSDNTSWETGKQAPLVERTAKWTQSRVYKEQAEMAEVW